MVSLLNKVKAKLSQKVQTSKEAKQRRELNESMLNKEREEARWQGYRKGAIAQAKKEGYRQASAKSSRGRISGTLATVGTRANAGLNFMNQDFATAFDGTHKPNAKEGKGKKKKKKPQSSMFDIGF